MKKANNNRMQKIILPEAIVSFVDVDDSFDKTPHFRNFLRML